MRTTKFRGFVAELGKFVYGDLLLNNGHPIIVIQVERSYIGTTYAGAGSHWHIETPAYKVKPETVGEFTGLHDKNGNEIYEGDILDAYHSSFEKTQRGFVFFDNGTFMLCSVNKEGVKRAVRYWNDGSHDWYSMENYDSFELEIIGNIYENPELL